MPSYIGALCFTIAYACYSMGEEFKNETATSEHSFNSKPVFGRIAEIKSQIPHELVSFVELSSNSLPVHSRVPRNLRFNKSPRRTQYRHSTRVYTNKPVPFLLPPEISNSNYEHNYFESKDVKPSTVKVKTEDLLVPTTTSSTTTKLSPVISQPAIILEPPYIETQHPVQNIIKKYRNRNRKLHYRGQKRYYARQQLKYSERKKEEITSTIPVVTTTASTAFTLEPVAVSTTSHYEFSETSGLFNTTIPQITTESIYSPTEEPKFTLTTFYTEEFYDNITQNASISTMATELPFVSSIEDNYTTPNEYIHNDITSSLLSPEVASMGMKVVATKKGIEMVRQNWLDVEATTTLNFETNSREKVDDSNGNLRLSVAETGDYRTKLLNNFRQHTESQNSVDHVIPGVAGVDYPTYNSPPPTVSKPCSSGVGYVADTNSGCQVFYICIGNGVGEPLLCPNGTLFSQDFLVCDWWYNVECHG